jgi:hypothetical protein
LGDMRRLVQMPSELALWEILQSLGCHHERNLWREAGLNTKACQEEEEEEEDARIWDFHGMGSSRGTVTEELVHAVIQPSVVTTGDGC